MTRARRKPVGLAARAFVGVCLVAAVLVGVSPARGERVQRGNLIVSLDGDLAPIVLPRNHPAPIAVHLSGGLRTDDGATLPRVRRIELGLPGQGMITTGGLASCSPSQLRYQTRAGALSACRPALVGSGSLRAEVVLPNQAPFKVRAQLLAFNGHFGGRRAVLVQATAANPPTSVVLPFVLHHRSGRFGLVLVADLPPALGPWPHFAQFEMTLDRRFVTHGRRRSYLSASCPIPRRFTAGFFSFAQATFVLADGESVGTGIARSCRAQGLAP